MNSKEILLLSKILEFSSHMFSSRICEDTPREWMSSWTIDEIKQLQIDFHKYNGDLDVMMSEIEQHPLIIPPLSSLCYMFAKRIMDDIVTEK